MAIIYVTTGPWGTGTGTPNTAPQVDGNFYALDQRIVDLNTDLATGKRIDHVTYTNSSMTFHYTDGTTQTIPLPVAVVTYVGQWMNSIAYVHSQMVSVPSLGMYQVLLDHTSPPPPATFNPNATDGGGNPLYSFWLPLYDVNYDAAIFVPGSIQRNADELLFQAIAGRSMRLATGDGHAYAYLNIGNNATGATNIVIAIIQNRSQVGTITFAAGGVVDLSGGQRGTFNIPLDVALAQGDSYGLRVVQSSNVIPAGLSVTLPFVRTDI